MESLKSFLAHVHYLNHPYLTGISVAGMLLIGAFVILKNIKSPVYRTFFWMVISISIWFIGNVFSMLNYSNFEAALFWYQFGYSGVVFIANSFYQFYLIYFHKNKRILLFLYLISIAEFLYLWLSNDARAGAYAIANVGVVWQGFPRFSYFLVFGMVKYTIITLITAFSFLREYKRETTPIRKQQIKVLTFIFFVLTGGLTEWLVEFDIPLHVVWVLMPFFVAAFAYVIIRYKAMEIDTVIHQTILWLVTILLLVIPAGALNVALTKLFPQINLVARIIASSIFLLLFVAYYVRLRPRIDHLFRRRKYDYQTVLGMVAERIATSISIEDLASKFLTEVCEAMYLRNALLYILSKDGKHYNLAGRRGYKERSGIRQPKELEVVNEEAASLAMPQGQRQIDCSASKMCQWMSQHQEVLEKEQIEVDPQYASIKDEAIAWFKEQDIEIAVPLVFEDKVQGVICLGKKENLQAYTIKDLELLKKLGQEAGVTVFNALHYEDLKEKERMDEELRMGRQIQMTLLPSKIPQVPYLSLQGLMQPAREIGGDYYDFITLPQKDELAVVIGDVSGKGVAAGLFMAMAKTAIHTISQEESSPKQILLRTNHILHQHISGQKFMTLLYLKWQAQSKTFTYSSAGHEHILIYRNKIQGIETIQSGGIMLGMLPEIETYMEEKQIQLQSGDKVLLYTDGVTEAQNQAGDRYTLDKLIDSFQRHSQKPPAELMQAVKDEVYSHIGNYPQYDDITLVVMEAQ